jgi:SAM-dependent methyltransferase
MKRTDFDKYAADYNELLHRETQFFSDDESYFARYKVEITRRLVTQPPGRLLEFGCGIGRNIPYLREAFPGSEVMGCDVSAKSVELARAANPGVDFWTEGEGGAGERGFDLIFVAGVFHHIPPEERPEAAALIAHRLNPGAMVVVFEHNPYNPITRRIVNECPYDEDAVLLSARELRGRLAAAGLQFRKQGYALFFPPKLAAFVRLEPLLAWLPLGGQYWVCAARP